MKLKRWGISMNKNISIGFIAVFIAAIILCGAYLYGRNRHFYTSNPNVFGGCIYACSGVENELLCLGSDSSVFQKCLYWCDGVVSNNCN